MSFSTLASEQGYLTDSTLVPELSSSFSSTSTSTSLPTSISTSTNTSFSSCGSWCGSNSSGLLFGEIDGGHTGTLPTKTPQITLPNTSSLSFLSFWLDSICRDTFLSRLPPSTLKSLRLVCHNFALRSSPHLFTSITIHFSSSLFSKLSKLAALKRISGNVRTVSWNFERNVEGLLQPLIDPWTGEEKPLLWDPKGRDVKERFCGEGMLELLSRQYSPVFFAATDVSGFCRILETLSVIEKVGVRVFEGEGRFGKNERLDVVDYALMSLRIAIEKSMIPRLQKLRFEGKQRDLLRFSPVNGIGAGPGSMRRWRGIKMLDVVLNNDQDGQAEKDKLLHSYLRNFTGLETLSFSWTEKRGKCPLPLPTSRIQNTSLHPALRSTTPTYAATFPKLQVLRIENAMLDAKWIKATLEAHRLTLKELELDNIVLDGKWEDALEGLGKGTEIKSRRCVVEEVGDVPIMLGSCVASTKDNTFSASARGKNGKVAGTKGSRAAGEEEEEEKTRVQGEVRRMLMTEEEVRMECQVVQGQNRDRKKKVREKGWIQKTCAGVFGWMVRG